MYQQSGTRLTSSRNVSGRSAPLSMGLACGPVGTRLVVDWSECRGYFMPRSELRPPQFVHSSNLLDRFRGCSSTSQD
jgi:hypothetical protein